MLNRLNLDREKDEIRNELQGWKKIAWERLDFSEQSRWAGMITGTCSASDVARKFERHFHGEEDCQRSESLSWHQEY